MSLDSSQLLSHYRPLTQKARQDLDRSQVTPPGETAGSFPSSLRMWADTEITQTVRAGFMLQGSTRLPRQDGLINLPSSEFLSVLDMKRKGRRRIAYLALVC